MINYQYSGKRFWQKFIVQIEKNGVINDYLYIHNKCNKFTFIPYNHLKKPFQTVDIYIYNLHLSRLFNVLTGFYFL